MTRISIFQEDSWGSIELIDEVVDSEKIITLDQNGTPISIPRDKFKEFVHWLSIEAGKL